VWRNTLTKTTIETQNMGPLLKKERFFLHIYIKIKNIFVMDIKQFIKEEVSKFHKKTLLENKKAQIEKELRLLKESVYINKYGIETINKPIISDALMVISKDENAVKFTNKEEFNSFLEKQKYFSASYSHCYYSEEDYQAAQRGDEKFRNGSTGISEADRGCVILFETGRELIAVWSEKDKIGFIIPSDSLK